MAEERIDVHIPSRPAVLDSIRLRDIHLSLPAAPDSWHRQGKPQPCTASLKLSYSSAVAAAAADDVSLSLDYGKLYRRLVDGIQHIGQQNTTGQPTVPVDKTPRNEKTVNALSQDVRIIGAVVTDSGLGLLDETAAGVRRMSQHEQGAAVSPIDGGFGQCESWVHLPKASLRAEGGIKYRSVTMWGYKQPLLGSVSEGVAATTLADAGTGRQAVVLEEEFRIEGIRCHAILGVNSHERLEKQPVIVSLQFAGPGQLAWATTVVDTYPEMTRVVAEVSFPFSLFFWFSNRLYIDSIVVREWKEPRSRPWKLWLLSWHVL